MFSAKVIAVCSLLGSLSSIAVYAEHYHATGVLHCHGDPYGDGFVSLWEWDMFNSHDLLATVATDTNGYFYITGSQTEWAGSINPYLKLYHKCGHEDLEPNCYWMEDLKASKRNTLYTDKKDKKVDYLDRKSVV